MSESSAAPESVTLPYPRVLLKLSGEVFGGGAIGVDPNVAHSLAIQIADVVAGGTQVAIVVGGGNFFRGAELSQRGMDRDRADYMGMLGTVMNCLALQDFLEKTGVPTRVQTAITMGQVAEPYIPRRAERHLEKGRVVIFGAGAGLPYFSTDTVAAQRALEIGCEVLLLGKNGVDGVYSADPRIDPTATRFDAISYDEVLRRGLDVADATAFSLCRDNGMPIVVFGLSDGNIARVVREEKMEKAVHVARDDLAGLRTGRANVNAFARLVVDYYGAPTPIPQMATVNVPEARMAVIKPYDASQLSAIEKAIRDSDLGVNPTNDGTIIRVVFPQLTEERRRELVKVAKGKGEDAKVSIRSIRRHAKDELDRLAKDGEAGEDDVHRAEAELDKLTHTDTNRVDEAVKAKESELLEV